MSIRKAFPELVYEILSLWLLEEWNNLFHLTENIMGDCRDQRVAVKFCSLLEKLKSAYGDAAVSKTIAFEWLSRFRNGERSIEDKPCVERPPNIKK